MAPRRTDLAHGEVKMKLVLIVLVFAISTIASVAPALAGEMGFANVNTSAGSPNPDLCNHTATGLMLSISCQSTGVGGAGASGTATLNVSFGHISETVSVSFGAAGSVKRQL
jgi:hypothetical protein